MNGWKNIRKKNKNTPIGGRKGVMERKGGKKKKRKIAHLGGDFNDPFERAYSALKLHEKGIVYILKHHSFSRKHPATVMSSQFLFTRDLSVDPKEVPLYTYLLYLTGMIELPPDANCMFAEPIKFQTPGDYMAGLRLFIINNNSPRHVYRQIDLVERLIEYEKEHLMNSDFVEQYKRDHMDGGLKEYIYYRAGYGIDHFFTKEAVNPPAEKYEWKTNTQRFNAMASVRYKSQLQKMRGR